MKQRPLLSILVASITSREAYLDRLITSLAGQCGRVFYEEAEVRRAGDMIEISYESKLEIIACIDEGYQHGGRSIGQKRNDLLHRATGEYVCFIDDDDMVSETYVPQIWGNLITAKPECIGFRVSRFSDSQYIGEAVHSIACKAWGHASRLSHPQNPNLVLYLRTPNHLNPVRREIALLGEFPDQNWGEDQEYAKKIMPHLKIEVFIDDELYRYYYRTPMNRHEESSPGEHRLSSAHDR